MCWLCSLVAGSLARVALGDVWEVSALCGARGEGDVGDYQALSWGSL